MQQDIATTRSIEGKDGPAITVGLDVGDRYTHVHALGAGGEVIRERRVRTVAIGLDLDQVNVDVQRLCPLNSSAKMSSRAGRCSVDDAAPWRLGGPPARR